MFNITLKDIFLILLGGYVTLSLTRINKHFDIRFKLWEKIFDYYIGLYRHIDNFNKLLNDKEVTTSSLIINYSDYEIKIFLNRYKPVLEINKFYFLIKFLIKKEKALKSNKNLVEFIKKYNKIMIDYKYIKDIEIDDLDKAKILLTEILNEIDRLVLIYKKFLFK